MNDFTFMRSGISDLQNDDNFEENMMKKTKAILTLVIESSIDTAVNIMRACQRSVVTEHDMKLALMYEAMKFWERDGLDERFARAMEVVQADTSVSEIVENSISLSDPQCENSEYESDQEDDTDSEGVESEQNEESGDVEEEGVSDDGEENKSAKEDDTSILSARELIQMDEYQNISSESKYVSFMASLKGVAMGWDDWNPEDPVKAMMKRAIEKNGRMK
jgi:hypothetical protein